MGKGGVVAGSLDTSKTVSLMCRNVSMDTDLLDLVACLYNFDEV